MAGEVAIREPALLGASVKYNPHLWGASELRAIFVVRQGELQRLQTALRASKPDSVPQHILITGQRGMGKSTLLQRLALAVREDETLRLQWIPLTFPEEQYTVSTLAEFWRDVLDALADALQREGATAEELAALDRKIRSLGDVSIALREDSALETLRSWVREHKRGVLLLIDSTDQLFSALGASEHGAKIQAARSKNARRATKAGGTALWRLRKSLSHETGIFWIGASYQALEASDLYHDTFHEFFELLELRPLSLAEMRTAMLALARVFGAGRGLDGEAAVAEITRTLDARPERLQALRALTGGNPRTTVMLYELLSAASDDNVHGDITRLLDLMTPLYKARLETLADQPRKILAHLLEHWAPIAVGDLAKISGIPNTTVSGQLARLEADGLIEKTRLHGTTRSGYQASERFFNVWYLMRYAARRLRQRLSWLIEFMRLWYARDELAQLASTRASRHAQGLLGDVSSLEYSRAMAAALTESEGERLQLEWAVHSAAYRESRRQHMAIAQAMPGLFDVEGDDKTFASAEDYRARLDALDDKLARCPRALSGDRQAFIDAIKGSVWLSLAEKHLIATGAPGLTLDESHELVEHFRRKRDELVTQIGEESTNRMIELVRNGEFFPDLPDSKLAYLQMDSCFGHDGPTFCFLLGRYVAKHRDTFAERACRLAIELAPTEAKPWRLLGAVLENLGDRNDEAEAAYRRAIEIDPKWAMPWDDLGSLLYYPLKRYDEAEAAYRKAIELDPKRAGPWGRLGDLLRFPLKRYDEAEAAYRKAIELDPKSAMRWGDLGALLHHHLERYDEAEAAYRKAIELDPKSAMPWDDLGALLHYHLERYDEAEAAYCKAIELDPKRAGPWGRLGDLLRFRLKRYDEAEAAYRKAIELDPKWAGPWGGIGDLMHVLQRFNESEAAHRKAIELNPKWARPWDRLGELLQYHLNRYDEAEAAYHKAIELDPKWARPWNGLGNLLRFPLKRYDEAEAACRKAIGLDPKWARPWGVLGELLQFPLKRYDEAEAAYRKAIELDPTSDEPWIYLGNLLQDHLRRYDDAEAAYRRAITLASTEPHPVANLARLLASRGQREEAVAMYRQSIDLVQQQANSNRSVRNFQNVLLQAHLWLGNRDLATRALDVLVQLASGGDEQAFAMLREQVRECSRIGLSTALADLMDASEYAGFLQPLSLALQAASSGGEIQAGAAPEIMALAEEVRRELVEM